MKGGSWFRSQSSLILLVAVLVAISVVSCGSKQKRDFPLTIVACDKLGDSPNDKLPDDIIKLLLPVDVDKCTEVFLVPKPATLYRLGSGKNSVKKLDANISAGFAGNTNNPNLIKRKTKEFLEKTQIGSVFAQPNNEYANMKTYLDSYLDRIGKNALKIFYVDPDQGENTYSGVKICRTTDEVRSAIADKMCENDSSSVFVFLSPIVTEQQTGVQRTDEQKTLSSGPKSGKITLPTRGDMDAMENKQTASKY